MSGITIIACNDIESFWFASLAAENAEQERVYNEAADTKARLLDGSCDGCQEPSPQPLVMYRQEALCRGCCDAIGPRVYASLSEQARAAGEPDGPAYG